MPRGAVEKSNSGKDGFDRSESKEFSEGSGHEKGKMQLHRELYNDGNKDLSKKSSQPEQSQKMSSEDAAKEREALSEKMQKERDSQAERLEEQKEEQERKREERLNRTYAYQGTTQSIQDTVGSVEQRMLGDS